MVRRSLPCLTLVLLLALTDQAPTQGPGEGWIRRDLPEQARWSEFTHALAVGDNAYLLHGRDLHHLAADGTWRAHAGVLPAPVGLFSACTVDLAGKLVVVPGNDQPGFRLDPKTLESQPMPALALGTRRGAVVALDERNDPYVILGGRLPTFGRVVKGGWQPLADVNTVNPVGAYSAGLFLMPGDLLVAFGDHHVNTFRPATGSWDDKSDLYLQLGFRPALDRGGMSAQDPATRTVFMTLGKGSRSIGLFAANHRFYHLRPRLPFLLSDPDRTLWITHGKQGAHLNLLSREQGAVFSIAITDLRLIGAADRLAEEGSRFEVWNSRQGGSHGDLSRERDSACNLAYARPFIYIQRKNIVRQVEIDSWRHSPSGVGFQYGREFAVAGAAFCFDGQDRIYVYNGYSQDFWCLHLYESQAPGSPRATEQVPLADARVTRLCSIPEFVNTAPRDGRGENTPMAALGGSIWAMFDPTTRLLWRFDPRQDEWHAEGVLPAGVPYTDRDGAELMSDGERLWLLTADTLVDFRQGEGWGKPRKLGFRFSQDGGMAVLDRGQGLIYVTMGAGTRDFGVIRPRDGAHRLHRDFFPDVVSVPGRRIFLDHADGATWLYLFRGHDSAEYWRTKVSGNGRPTVE